MSALRGKRHAFVLEYLKDFNATEAYKRAGYKGSGEGARRSASRLLTNVDIQAEIQRLQSRVENRTVASLERLELELERIALSDPRKLFTKDGAMLVPSEWDDDTAAAVASIEVLEEFAGRRENRVMIGHTKKAKLLDKVSALVALLKRRDVAKSGELGSKENPINHRLAFIEFADVEGSEAVPGEGD